MSKITRFPTKIRTMTFQSRSTYFSSFIGFKGSDSSYGTWIGSSSGAETGSSSGTGTGSSSGTGTSSSSGTGTGSSSETGTCSSFWMSGGSSTIVNVIDSLHCRT